MPRGKGKPRSEGRPAGGQFQDHNTEPLRALNPKFIPFKTFIPKNPTQTEVMGILARHPLIFLTGPAGTGKSFLAVAYAMELLKTGKIDKIIVVRPAIEAGDSVGYL